MKLKAVHNYILAKQLPMPEGIFLPPNTVQQWVEIISVGPGTYSPYGKLIPLPFKEGDIVCAMRHGMVGLKSYEKILTEDQVFLIVEFDVMAVLTNKELGEISPLYNNLLIEPDTNEVETESGLLLPERRATPINTGTVIKLGTGWINADGSIIPWQVAAGDRVFYDPSRTMKVDLKTFGIDKQYLLVSHSDIMAIIE